MVDTGQVFSLEHFLMIKLYKLLKNPVPAVMETLTFHLGLTLKEETDRTGSILNAGLHLGLDSEL